MKSAKQRLEEIRDDPKKLKRAFTAIWVLSYAMLIIGFLIIVWVLIYGT